VRRRVEAVFASGRSFSEMNPHNSLDLDATLTGPSQVSNPRSQLPVANPEGKKLLFVGGSRFWFDEIEQALLELRPAWSAEHVTDQAGVENRLSFFHGDALLVDEEFAGGQEYLALISKKFPSAAGIWLRAQMNPGEARKGLGPGDMVVVKSNPEETAEKIVSSVCVHECSLQPSVRSLLARIKTLPSLPRLHTQITHELQSSNGSLELVSQYVRQDPVMAAKFLQVINSAAFARACTVTDPGEAVMFLGLARTRALVLMAGVFSQFDEMKCPGFSAEQIWRHSLQVASLAQGVALLQTEDPKLAELAFTAGLLHDIGKLVLASNVPEMYATAHRLQQHKQIQQAEAELTILSTNHAELGACLLGTWQLPLRIIEAVAWHHKPSQSADHAFSVLTAVHAANVFAHEIAGANVDIARPSTFDVFYLAKLGLTSRRNVWREGCGLPIKDEQDTFEDQLRRRRLETKHN
jgi:putative nucleotidyltransferase with HDIG domain